VTWKEAYWRLFHLFKQWLKLQAPRDDISGLRYYDKYAKWIREEIDQLTMVLPKE
jgi:hypothetical protein